MKDKLKGVILGIVLVIGLNYAGATWSDPTGSPTAGNPDVPVNVGNVTQTKGGTLQADAIVSLSDLYSAGFVKVGTTGDSCDASHAGAIKYSSGSMQYCNGTTWTAFSTGTSPFGSNSGMIYTYSYPQFTDTSLGWWKNCEQVGFSFGGGGFGSRLTPLSATANAQGQFEWNMWW